MTTQPSHDGYDYYTEFMVVGQADRARYLTADVQCRLKGGNMLSSGPKYHKGVPIPRPFFRPRASAWLHGCARLFWAAGPLQAASPLCLPPRTPSLLLSGCAMGSGSSSAPGRAFPSRGCPPPPALRSTRPAPSSHRRPAARRRRRPPPRCSQNAAAPEPAGAATRGRGPPAQRSPPPRRRGAKRRRSLGSGAPGAGARCQRGS